MPNTSGISYEFEYICFSPLLSLSFSHNSLHKLECIQQPPDINWDKFRLDTMQCKLPRFEPKGETFNFVNVISQTAECVDGMGISFRFDMTLVSSIVCRRCGISIEHIIMSKRRRRRYPSHNEANTLQWKSFFLFLLLRLFFENDVRTQTARLRMWNQCSMCCYAHEMDSPCVCGWVSGCVSVQICLFNTSSRCVCMRAAVCMWVLLACADFLSFYAIYNNQQGLESTKS